LLCSHLLADVQDVCDRITILFRGSMQTIGNVRDLLQVKDVTEIQTPSLNEQQIAEVKAFLTRLGVNHSVITHPTTTLEDLFIRIVRENTVTGQSSVGSG
jgi:ABC-2 type transport system ATP-binding protein